MNDNQTMDNVRGLAYSKSSEHFSGTLVGCLLISAMVCASQMIGNRAALLVCLFVYIIFTVWTCFSGRILPTLLFFLPWSPLMKLYTGGLSFFTVALLVTCVVFLIKNKMSIYAYQVVVTAVVAILTLIAKLLQGNEFDNEYLFFLFMLFLFPCVTREVNYSVSFWIATLFFTCGIISAALSAQQLVKFPNISQYIVVVAYQNITRLSGYYGDPNFYSAHITAALAGVQLLLIQETDKRRRILLALFFIILMYCGLLSASKMFVVVIAGLFLVWIPMILRKRGRGSNRIRLLLGIVCAGVIILSSSLFQDLIQIMDNRFAQASNMSEFTTGRTELWIDYIHELLHNGPLLLLGEGYSNVMLHHKSSHNTIIQAVYQFGIFGALMVFAWGFLTLKRMHLDIKKVDWWCAALLCIGAVLPWMGVDILFFDEFFLLPAYAALGTAYSSHHFE